MDPARPIQRIEFEQTVNADAAAQLRLLDLQGIDTTLAQLRHRRETLPELGLIAAARDRADGVRTQQLDVRTALDDTSGDQRRLENEVDAVRSRTTRDSERLTAGGLPSKELEGLQHEITSLARRQSSLEDDLLEVMEQRETRELELSGLDAELAGIEAEREQHEAARERAFAEIDAATELHQAQRLLLIAEIPADLLALYEKVAAAGGGVGAAMVKQRRCEGCHLELAGSELISVRAAADDAVLRCENCRRILVRTAESGL
jgi:predicted  nucleic acid-binding Zn-ribbon protein